MEPKVTTQERSARELEGAQRQAGKSWGGNRPGQWAVLGLVCLGLAAVAVVLALIA